MVFMQAVVKSAMWLHMRRQAEISFLSVTVCSLLCSFGEATQGTVQLAHTVTDSGVPALDPSLVSRQKKSQSRTSENLSFSN